MKLKVSVFLLLLVFFLCTTVQAAPPALLGSKPMVKPAPARILKQQNIEQSQDALLPDFHLKEVTYSGDKHEGNLPHGSNRYFLGTKLTFRIVVENKGQGPSEPTNLSFVICPSNMNDPWSQPSLPRWVLPVPPIYPGTQAVIEHSYTIEGAGYYNYWAWVNKDRKTPEDDKSYNDLGSPQPIEILKKFVDLKIGFIDLPTKATIVSKTKVEACVNNIGTTVSQPTRAMLHFVDSRAGTKYYEIPALMPNESKCVSYAHRYGKAGKKEVRGSVDFDRKTQDTDLSNNAAQFHFKVHVN